VRRFPSAAVLALELLGVNRLWPGNPWNRAYRYHGRDLTKPGPVEQPAGAFLAVRRDVWQRLGGFDEQFHPVWFEDVDFCKRAEEGGYGTWLVPEVKAAHVGGHSIQSMGSCRRQVQWYDSLLRYGAKHFRPASYGLVWVAGVLGAFPRAAVGVIQERNLRPIGCCFQILSLLGSRLVTRPPSGQVGRPGSDG
jgi:hypothetical protein